MNKDEVLFRIMVNDHKNNKEQLVTSFFRRDYKEMLSFFITAMKEEIPFFINQFDESIPAEYADYIDNNIISDICITTQSKVSLMSVEIYFDFL